MQNFSKTKGFCNKQGLFRKKITIFNKNYICIPIKASNHEYRVFEKKRFSGEKKRPLLIVPRAPPRAPVVQKRRTIFLCRTTFQLETFSKSTSPKAVFSGSFSRYFLEENDAVPCQKWKKNIASKSARSTIRETGIFCLKVFHAKFFFVLVMAYLNWKASH